MSHFTVLVIGDDPEDQLAPFQEMGGEDSPYTSFVDEEDQLREEYESGTTRQVKMPDGSFIESYNFSSKMEAELKEKNQVAVKVDRPFKEIYSSFEEFMSDYHGYEERNESMGRYGHWTNANGKWDWYSLGGRWAGMILLKNGSRVNQAKIKKIDFALMQKNAAHSAKNVYERIERIFGAIPRLDYRWDDLMNEKSLQLNLNAEEKRDLYHNQPAMKMLGEMLDSPLLSQEDKDYLRYLSLEKMQVSKEKYIQDAINSSFLTFAVIKDGKWHERGSMGFFGTVTNEKDQGEWSEEYARMLLDLDPDTLISIYDCHC